MLFERRFCLKNSENLRAEQRDFTHAISHDLKAPFTTLNFLIDEIRKKSDVDLSEDTLQLFQLADSTITRSYRFIEDVLSYSSSLHINYEPELVKLNDVFNDIRHDLMADIEGSGACINIPDLPAVMGSSMQLKLLFQNIVHNAIKFKKLGMKPIINITSATNLEISDICISDNGIGISPEFHTRIFNLFEQLHTQDEHPGSGLGLTLAHRVAANHGGSIDVESKPLEGTTFRVSLAGAHNGSA
jgi:light-regulated signal transduction histidine kinase (bacteriophytochrome)